MNNEEKEESKAKDISILYTSGKVKSSQYRDAYSAKKNRKEIDDVSKRNAYRDAQFGDNKTITDPYTNQILHKDSKAAMNKYGKKQANKHTAQTDHTVPLQKVYDRNRHNTFLSKEDIKEIGNIEGNYKVINGNTNQSKGSKSNLQAAKANNVDKTQKQKMVKEQIKAESVIAKKTAELTLKRANEYGMASAKTGAGVGAAVSTTENIKAVFNGEEDVVEALTNIGIDTAKSAAESYAAAIATKSMEGASHAIGEKIAEKSSKVVLKNLGEQLKVLDAGAIGQIITVTADVGQSMNRYLHGEITGGELVLELGEKGTSMATSICSGVIGAFIGTAVAGVPGAVIGEIIGNMVGSIIGSKLYNGVIEYFDKIGSYDANIAMYERMADRIQEYRLNLETNFKIVNMTNTKIAMDSFETIKTAILNNDAESFNNALRNIGRLYDKDIAFKSNKEFMDFWNNPEMVLKI